MLAELLEESQDNDPHFADDESSGQKPDEEMQVMDQQIPPQELLQKPENVYYQFSPTAENSIHQVRTVEEDAPSVASSVGNGSRAIGPHPYHRPVQPNPALARTAQVPMGSDDSIHTNNRFHHNSPTSNTTNSSPKAQATRSPPPCQR